MITATYQAGRDVWWSAPVPLTALSAQPLAGGDWPEEASGTRVGRALDSVSWPAGCRSIDNGIYNVVSAAFGPGASSESSALAHLTDVADSELGYVFMNTAGTVVYHDGAHRQSSQRSIIPQALFSDDTAGGFRYTSLQPSYDYDQLYNDIQVTGGTSGATAQVAGDSVSQSEYLRHTYTKQTLLANNADAADVASSLLAAYKDPKQRFPSISTVDDGSEVWAETMYGLEIGDLVAVRTNPPATSVSINYDCYVEAIQLDREPGMPDRFTFQLTQISATVGTQSGGGGGGALGALLDSSGDDFTLDDAVKGVLGT